MWSTKWTMCIFDCASLDRAAIHNHGKQDGPRPPPLWTKLRSMEWWGHTSIVWTPHSNSCVQNTHNGAARALVNDIEKPYAMVLCGPVLFRVQSGNSLRRYIGKGNSVKRSRTFPCNLRLTAARAKVTSLSRARAAFFTPSNALWTAKCERGARMRNSPWTQCVRQIGMGVMLEAMERLTNAHRECYSLNAFYEALIALSESCTGATHASSRCLLILCTA